MCIDMTVIDVRAEVWKEALFGKWDPFWRASGSYAVSAGDVVSAQTLKVGLQFSKDSEPDLNPGDLVDVGLYGDAYTPDASAVFEIGDRGLTNEEWLLSDGTYAGTPCDTY